MASSERRQKGRGRNGHSGAITTPTRYGGQYWPAIKLASLYASIPHRARDDVCKQPWLLFLEARIVSRDALSLNLLN